MSVKEIYNQGRVVGYSAYEIYVRQHMAVDPETPPATEREWLASMIGSGASMLLKLDDTCFKETKGDFSVYEVALPEESTLYAASTIVGSFFTGNANYDSVSHFATYVKNYGSLVSNIAASHPAASGDVADQPSAASLGLSATQLIQLQQYANIVDGVILAPKTWEASGVSEPYMDFKPDLADTQVLRILIRGDRDASLNIPILLVGFTMNSILSGISSEEGSVNTEFPANGDFLGPSVVPWANKIVFSIPPAYVSYFHNNAYHRKLPTSGQEVKVDDNPVIDMRHTDPSTYYENGDNGVDAKNKSYSVPLNVTELHVNKNGAAVLTVYSYDGINLPPALYGSRVIEEGAQEMYPLDVVSPGTIKAFDIDDIEDARRLQNTVPGNKSIIINKDFTFSALDDNGNVVPIASTDITREDDGTASNSGYYVANVRTGNKVLKSISLQDTSRNDLPTTPKNNSRFVTTAGTTGASGTGATFNSTNVEALGDNPLVWDTLLKLLASDKGIDILGAALRKFISRFPNLDTSHLGAGILKVTGTGESSVGGAFTSGGKITSGGDVKAAGVLDVDGTGESNIAGSLTAAKKIKSTGESLQSGKQYIEFKDGKRLYISSTAPSVSGVPEGSIGIGW